MELAVTDIKITAAQRRALEAVRDGKCFRRYYGDGNSYHGPDGVSAVTLWRLERQSWIRDGDSRRSGFDIVCAVALTDEGRMALRRAEEQS